VCPPFPSSLRKNVDARRRTSRLPRGRLPDRRNPAAPEDPLFGEHPCVHRPAPETAPPPQLSNTLVQFVAPQEHLFEPESQRRQQAPPDVVRRQPHEVDVAGTEGPREEAQKDGVCRGGDVSLHSVLVRVGGYCYFDAPDRDREEEQHAVLLHVRAATGCGGQADHE
jgi:hypothetical protein